MREEGEWGKVIRGELYERWPKDENGEPEEPVRLGTLIAPCLRPDLPPGMVVEDLRMLAKQGVSFEALTEVLAAQLACKPTQSMLDALRVMYGTTPGFICVNSRLVH